MKKVKFLALLICAFSLVAFYSCSKDDDDTTTTQSHRDPNPNPDPDPDPDPDPEPSLEEQILGSWEGEYSMTLGTLDFTATLNADYTGSVSATYGLIPVSGDITWSLTDRVLTATISLGTLIGEKNISCNIVSVDETTMVISVSVLGESSDPKEVTLTRVTE